MSTPEARQTAHAQHFRHLHQAGNPFILANVWDIGSARMLAAAGAVALATTSSGHAFTVGLPDMGHVPREQALAHAAQLVQATKLPVSADCENGYGDTAEQVAETVRRAIAAGLAGCSIEDTMLPDDKPYPFAEAVVRIQAAVVAARQAAADFVLTARADGVMLGHYHADEALRRLLAFEAAGADVLYAPMLPDMAALEKICNAVSAPVNVLVAGDFCRYTVADFASIGVARLSLGGSLARLTQAAVQQAAAAMLDGGTFLSLAKAANGDEIEAMLIQGAADAPPQA